MFNPYKQFKLLYPKDIQIESIVIIFHIFRKTFFNVGRDMGDTSVSGSTFLLFACIGLNFWVVHNNKKILSRAIKENKWFLYYILFCGISFLWNVIDVAGFTTVFAKDLEILSSFLVLSVVLYKISDLNRCAIYVLYIMTLAALSGGLAQGFNHTNSYSFSAMLGTIMSYGLMRNYKMKNIHYFFIANLFAMVLGTSSGTYIAFICGVLVMFSTNKKGVKIIQAVTVAVIAYFVYESAYDFIAQYIYYGHDQNAIEGGTGRYEIWALFIDAWKESPWLGYGYIVGERNFGVIGDRDFIFSAHNGYISVLINTGLIGMSIFLYYTLQTIFRSLNKSQISNPAQSIASVCFAALIGLLVNNISYPAFGSDWNHTFPPMMCLLILINTMKNKSIDMAMPTILTKYAWNYRKNG